MTVGDGCVVRDLLRLLVSQSGSCVWTGAVNGVNRRINSLIDISNQGFLFVRQITYLLRKTIGVWPQQPTNQISPATKVGREKGRANRVESRGIARIADWVARVA
jgi:hypothetical protein